MTRLTFLCLVASYYDFSSNLILLNIIMSYHKGDFVHVPLMVSVVQYECLIYTQYGVLE